MDYLFDIKADRSGDIFWLKEIFTPDSVKEAGLISLKGAEFEFPTYEGYSKAVAAAAAKGVFGYNIPGRAYKDAVCYWLKASRDVEIDPEWIITTHGTIFSLATAIRMFVGPEDSMIVPVPGYNRYEQAATRMGLKTTFIRLKENKGVYELDFDLLEKAMAREDTKLLVICNPNNPCGNAYSREELLRIAELSKRYGVAVFADEIFADIAYDGLRIPCYAEVAGEDALAISCTSLGKTFSLTCVNHANVIIKNKELRERYRQQRDADHYGSIDPMTYAGLLGVYNEGGIAFKDALIDYVRGNYRLFCDFFAEKLPQVTVGRPAGTYVVWVDYSGLGLDSDELNRLLVDEGCLAGDEGEEYYGNAMQYRYSLALPRKELQKILGRLDMAITKRNLNKK